ncbi:MAG: hypothetical protein JSV91_07415 [Phycisphaerales bacterium]|nr:MAG: hypothetical protein JSV91_07415 [Phycisphaerales bacterium]
MAGAMIIFDDDRGELGPMTDLRASFEVRTGMHSTAARLAALHPRMLAGFWVPDRLKAAVAERADAPVNELPRGKPLYCANGRWALPDRELKLRAGEAVIEAETGDVVAAMLEYADAVSFLQSGELHGQMHAQEVPVGALYRYPWQVIDRLKETIPRDIETLLVLDALIPPNESQVVGHHPVKVHESARVYPDVVFDAENGPIVVREGATVRPGAVLCGPCSIGCGATVVDRTLIKANTAIGPMCKVGGEIGATIFQGYSNKAHDGHLGDSWVGKWVNLGAGTTNSNLLNTYGEVSMLTELGGQRHRTGLTFLGSVIGDHVKTAICTRLMTGSVLGTGAMIATTAAPPTTVKRFAWLTDSGERTYRFSKFIEVMKAMMQRRDTEPSDAYMTLLKALYDKHAAST